MLWRPTSRSPAAARAWSATARPRSGASSKGSERARQEVPMSALFLALLLVADDAPATMDPAAIPNYTRVRPGLAVAGKPSSAALAHLKEQGFKTVIDLRMPTEGLEEEKASVEGQGLKYVSVPFTSATFSLADALRVKGVLDDPASGPVLLHCAAANRAGGVL